MSISDEKLRTLVNESDAEAKKRAEKLALDALAIAHHICPKCGDPLTVKHERARWLSDADLGTIAWLCDRCGFKKICHLEA